jgi:hypothetical protein
VANIFVLPHVFESEIAVRTDLLGALPANVPPNSFPTAIRWRIHQDLGFSRVPFKVFRRPSGFAVGRTELNIPITTIAGATVLEWGRIPLIEVRFNAAPTTGGGLSFQAVDDRGKPILGERVQISSAIQVRLRAPGICAIQATGSGSISNAVGVKIADLANDTRWELIEIVGLPVKNGQVSASVYDSGPLTQGHPAALKPGFEAAKDRLNIALTLYRPPPATDPSGGAAPAWPAPPIDQILTETAIGANSPLGTVLQMLGAVDTQSLSLTQANFEREFKGAGLRQPGGPLPADSASGKVKLASMVLLSAATDIWTAIALGFGATDFPTQQTDPPSGVAVAPHAFSPAFDYMVTADYTLLLGIKITIGAIACPPRFPTIPPTPFEAHVLRRHRPLTRDQAAGADVALTWNRLPRQIPPQGYALGIRQGGGAPQVLNQPRKGVGFIPYVPARRPDGDLTNEAKAQFIDFFRSQPVTGTRTDIYLAAATDIFGRWSTWSTVAQPASPDPPALPHILDAKFQLNVSAVVGRAIPATLLIDFLWDFQDRSPSTVEFRGEFASTGISTGAVPAGFQHIPGGPPDPPVIVTIPLSGPPTVTGGGSAVELPAQPDDGESRRYRLTVIGLTADFTPVSRLSYAVFARASEAVSPTLFSDFTPAFLTQTRDPLPPTVPPLVPQIHWAALPDASGTARGHITFAAATAAAGYVVYEARESAIRTAAGLPASTDGDLEARAAEVLLAAETPAALDTFTRVNTSLLPTPEAEVELPGTSTALFVFKISAMSAEQVESPLSNTVLVAVPQRITPGTPRLRARPKAGGGVEIVVEPGPGSAPVGISLFRVNATSPPPDVDSMGPPVFAPGDAAWQVSGGIFRLTDPVIPSWRPYFYRAVAVGPDDPDHGRRSGRSKAAGPVDVFVPPSTPPDLTALTQTVTPDNLVQTTFRSSADTKRSPIGAHHLSVSTIDLSGGVPVEHLQADADLPDIAPLTPPVPEAPGQILRGTRDAAGRFLYEVFVPKGDTDLRVRLVDPAGRASELRAPLTTASPQPPDLQDLKANVTVGFPSSTLRASVRSSAPTGKPPTGAFLLELIGAGPAGKRLLARATLDSIGTAPGTGKFVRSGPGPDHRFTYSIILNIGPLRLTVVAARLTDPNNLRTELSVSVS